MVFSGNRIYDEDIKDACERVIGLEMLNNASVLITGATGLIGSFIVEVLLCANDIYNYNTRIFATGRSIERLEKRFERYKSNEMLSFIEYDVCGDIHFSENFDYIIHAASNAYPAAFTSDPVGTIEANILGVKKLLDYGKEHDLKKFLFVSSGEVYGQLPLDTQCFTEDMSGYVDPLQVRSCYSLSKRVGENYCISYARQYGIQTVIVRPCHTYGANFTTSDNRATVQFFNNVLDEKDIILKSEGKQIRSYMYVADCAPAILTVMCKGENGSAYNISNSNSVVSIRQFAELTAKEAGLNVMIDIPQEKIKDDTPITRQVLSSDKLDQLGFCSNYSCEQGIKRTLSILRGVCE